MSPPRLLTVAGSDSGGGAGIQADLKTFAAFGGYGMSAVTALTAQNTVTVANVLPADPAFVAEQIRLVAEDIGVDAAKTGMLFSAPIIRAVADALSAYRFPVVVDPVMVAKTGDRLLEEEAIAALSADLLPRALVVTPNLPEAAALTGLPVDTEPRRLARAVQELGAPWVLLKGGHGNGPEIVDLLVGPAGFEQSFRHPRLSTRNTHGTGCTLSAAVTAGLGGGLDVPEAIARAITYVTGAVAHGLPFGRGHGPLDHFWERR
jgi:hydroxymethylpyrimidine kinase/phosphomethylpyrimidine kinase